MGVEAEELSDCVEPVSPLVQGQMLQKRVQRNPVARWCSPLTRVQGWACILNHSKAFSDFFLTLPNSDGTYFLM